MAIPSEHLINLLEGPVVYPAEEIQGMNQWASPDDLRIIHNIKRKMEMRLIILNRIGNA